MSARQQVIEAIEDVDYCLRLIRKWGAITDEEVSAALLEIAEALTRVTDFDEHGNPRTKEEVMSYIYNAVTWCIRRVREKKTEDYDTLGLDDLDREPQSDKEEQYNKVITSTIIDSLPREARRTVVLCMMGFSSREIEEITGVSRGRQWRVKQEAKRKIRKYYPSDRT